MSCLAREKGWSPILNSLEILINAILIWVCYVDLFYGCVAYHTYKREATRHLRIFPIPCYSTFRM